MRGKQDRYFLNIRQLQLDLQLSNMEMGMRLVIPVSSYVMYKKSGIITLKILRKFYNAFGQNKIKKYLTMEELK
jgi:hypothetical protein